MKKIAICPQCHSKVIVEGELNQKISIQCYECGKKGVIVFRKPAQQSITPPIPQKKPPIQEKPKSLPSIITSPLETTSLSTEKNFTHLERKGAQKQESTPDLPTHKIPREPSTTKTSEPTDSKSSDGESLPPRYKKKIRIKTKRKHPTHKKAKSILTDKSIDKESGQSKQKKKFSLFKKKEELSIKDPIQKHTDQDKQKISETPTQTKISETETTNTSQGTTVSILEITEKSTAPPPSTTGKKIVDQPLIMPLNTRKIPGGSVALEELDFYPVNEPFAYIKILRDTETLDKYYKVIEPPLNQQDTENLEFIENELIKTLNVHLNEIEVDFLDSFLTSEINKIIKSYELNTADITIRKFLYYIKRDFIGNGKIDPLMRDPNIEDISCDGSEVPVFIYHRIYCSLKSNVIFSHEKELSAYVVRLAQKCGKHISIAEPMLDATMPDGSRIQMTLSKAVTAKGSTFTIRKFRDDPITPTDLISYNTMSAEMIAYMWMAVENGINALIAGGTASGKTSALNALALFIPRESKIVSIEETREINLPHPNWIPGVSRSGLGEVVNEKMVGEIGLFDLMKAALRQRPEYIIVGEIRGQEAYVLFQAMATGHTTYSTVHADSPKSLIHRLEGKPINIPRMMLQSLDIVLIQSNVHMNGKNVRRTRQIVEIIDIDSISKEILTNEVFHWDPVTDKHIYLGKSYILERIRSQCDMSIEGLSEEFRRRVHILDWMRQKNIRVFNDVATIISSYKENPTELMKQMEAEENQSSTVTTPHSRENKNNNIDKNKQKIVDKRKSKKKLWRR